MRQPSRNVSNSRIEHRSSENGLFQLPSLPPWRTPKIRNEQIHNTDQSINQHYKNNYATPSRKSPSLLLYHSQLPSQYLQDDQHAPDMDMVGHLALPDVVSQELNTEYDYSPLSNKSLLCNSKVDDFLHAERAAHCLVFHKDMHPKGIDEYRPDLDTSCGEQDALATAEGRENDSILQHVPGCTKQDMDFLLKKDLISQRPNIRRIDEILNHEANALSRFWDDVDLPKTLDRNHLHEQYLILQQEQKELDQVKATLQPHATKMFKNKWTSLHSDK